jgi:dihydrofolate reductase
MKVILYMAATLNGLIARADDDTTWITKEEWDSYSAATRAAGNLIVGHRTYEILTKQPEFSELNEVRVVVVARTEVQLIAANHSIASSPKRALEAMDGASEVIVAGGGALNAAFIAENLIDEIYVDIEPLAFSPGIPLSHDTPFEVKLALLEIKKITESEIQLHYAVLK